MIEQRIGNRDKQNHVRAKNFQEGQAKTCESKKFPRGTFWEQNFNVKTELEERVHCLTRLLELCCLDCNTKCKFHLFTDMYCQTKSKLSRNENNVSRFNKMFRGLTYFGEGSCVLRIGFLLGGGVVGVGVTNTNTSTPNTSNTANTFPATQHHEHNKLTMFLLTVAIQHSAYVCYLLYL